MAATAVLVALMVGTCSAIRLGIRPSPVGESAAQPFGAFAPSDSHLRLSEFKLRAKSASKNVFDPWKCSEEGMGTDKYLKNHNHEWPQDEFKEMLENRKATVFYNPWDQKLYERKKEEAGPFCPTSPPDFFAKQGDPYNDDGFALHYAMDIIEKQTKHIEKNGDMVVMIDVKHLGAESGDTASNALCSLKRVGLLDRAVVFLGAESVLTEPLRKAFPEAAIVEDKKFRVPEKNDRRHMHANFNWRWVPTLALLELGYPVMHLDPDVHVIKDPREFIQTTLGSEADVVSTYENCLDLNGGINFFRSNERAKDMLRHMLAMEHEFETFQSENGTSFSVPAEGDDQWSMACAAAYGVTNGMKLRVIPVKDALFHWDGIGEFYKQNCYGEKSGKEVTLEKFPYFMHTSFTDSPLRPGKMKMLGLLEKEENGGIGQCKEVDPIAQCKAGMTVPFDGLVDALNA